MAVQSPETGSRLPPSGAGRGNPFASVLDLLGTAMALAQTRLELMATEIEQEKRRLLSVMAWGAVAVLLGCFGLLFLALLVTAVLWDTHRLLALGSSVLFFAGGGAWAWVQVMRRLQHDEGLLPASLAEFEGDRAVLGAAAESLRQSARTTAPPAGGRDAQ